MVPLRCWAWTTSPCSHCSGNIDNIARLHGMCFPMKPHQVARRWAAPQRPKTVTQAASLISSAQSPVFYIDQKHQMWLQGQGSSVDILRLLDALHWRVRAFMGHLDSKPWTLFFHASAIIQRNEVLSGPKRDVPNFKHDLLLFREILGRSNPKIWMLEDILAVGICKASLKGSAPNQMTLRFGDRVCHICLEPQIWNDLKPDIVASLHKKRADVCSGSCGSLWG